MPDKPEDLSCPRCRNDDGRRFHCPYCCEEFDGPRYLSAHVIREHR